MKRESKYRRDAPADGLARHFQAGAVDGLGDSHQPGCSRKSSVGAVLVCGSIAVQFLSCFSTAELIEEITDTSVLIGWPRLLVQ